MGKTQPPSNLPPSNLLLRPTSRGPDDPHPAANYLLSGSRCAFSSGVSISKAKVLSSFFPLIHRRVCGGFCVSSNYSSFYGTARAMPRIRWDLSAASPSRVSRIFPSRRVSCGLRGNVFIVFSPQPGGGNFGSLQELITPVPAV